MSRLRVRPSASGDDVSGWLQRFWGDTTVAAHGELYDCTALPNLVAERDGRLLGALSYTIADGALEIVSCVADPPGRGVGRRLVDAAVAVAGDASVDRVWCTTTNDNLPALGFWQALGFTLVRLRPDAVAAARARKPGIPAWGHRGLPIRDELDLEVTLPRASG